MLERMCGKGMCGNTPTLLVGVQIDTAALEISIAISQKIRKQPTSIPLLGIYPKDAQLYHMDMRSTMLTASLFVIVRT